MRPTEAVIDLAAFGRNIEELVRIANPAKLCAVTKADGYGHGAVACSHVALEAGVSWLAVALVEEAIELRQAGITAPILLLSEPPPTAMTAVVDHDVVATVYSVAGLAALSTAAKARASAAPVPVHVNLDTGLNRTGLRPPAPFTQKTTGDYVVEMIRAVNAETALDLSGIWTHFAVADTPERNETKEQLARFDHLMSSVRDELEHEVLVHAANSAGLLAFDGARFDMVRVGIAAYGIAPSPQLETRAKLEPVLSLTSELSMVKRVFAGEGISYGLRHQFAHDTMVGTMPIGYADGLRRDSFARGASVLVGGEPRPIVGVVTMDHTMIDLGPDTKSQPGDSVVLIGTQGEHVITATQVADRLDTIPYEVVCSIGARVRRRYT